MADDGPGSASYALGVGLSSRVEAPELAALVDATLRAAGIPRRRVALVATVDTRAGHPALAALGWPVVAFPASELAGVSGAGPGERVVAEPAALLAAGPGAVLVVPKCRSARATVAVARTERPGEAHAPSDVRR